MRLPLLLLTLAVVVALCCTTTQECSDEQFCNGLETCNSDDGNCSPETNEDTLASLCSSYTHPRQCTHGYCNSATQTCGAWTDLTLGNPCGLSNVGACKIGVISCNADTSSLVCSGRVDPVPEIASNGIDDDCDGITDNAAVVPCSSTLDCQASTDCIDASCSSGFCTYTPKNAGATCDARGPACLGPYYCNAKGQCMARSTIACATSPYSSDPTTRSNCLITKCVNGACATSRWSGPCDDNNACTVNDACSPAGVCIGTPVSCDDNDPCTTDYCSVGLCVHTPIADCSSKPRVQSVVVAPPSNISVHAASISTDSTKFYLLITIPVAIIVAILIIVIVVASINSINKAHDKKLRTR